MNIAKLKDQARKYELKDQFDKAINTYNKILDELDGTPELEDELALFNKVGDLYLKKKDTNGAVEMYEKAAEHYRSSGFPNNAIALYNKVLRNAPSRTDAYLRLGELMVGRGFAAEAKKNFVVYLDRMEKEGKLDQAFSALRTIADNAEDNEEIRLMLAGHLRDAARTDEAKEQLSTLYSETQAHGDERKSRATLEKMQAIDPDFQPEGSTPSGSVPRKKKQSDIVFLDLESGEEEVLAPVDDVERIEDEPVAEIEVVAVPELESAGDVEKPADEYTPHANDGADLDVDLAGGGESAFGDEDLITQTTFDEGAGTETDVDDSLDLETAADSTTGESSDGASKTGSELDADVPSLVSDMTFDVGDSPDDKRASLGLGAEVPLYDIDAETQDDGEPVLDGAAGGDLDLDQPIEIDLPDQGGDLDELVLEGPEESLEELLAATSDEGPSDPVEESLEELLAATSEEDSSDLVLEGPPADDFSEVVAEDTASDDGFEDLVVEESTGGESLEDLLLDVVAAPTLADLEEAVSADPTDPEKRYDLAEAMVEGGMAQRAIGEYDEAISILDGRGDNERAIKVLDAVLRLDSNSSAHHRRKVEILSRMGDKQALVAGYLAYADALLRGGDMDGARTAYLNVLEHDASNDEARTALDTVVPEAPAAEPAGGGDFINLGELIFGDDEVEMDTRMTTQSTEQSGDEDADFQEMLGEFKKGIEENIDEGDAEAHYDLGVAFKEMGLLDEAISEFQKALRGAESRLKASESLGMCFFEKGQFPVAGTVLRRAVEADHSPDEKKVGLLYWLARCEEEQGNNAEALAHYQRVFAVDIKFQDVHERVNKLA